MYERHLSKLPSLKSEIRLFYSEFIVDFDRSFSEMGLEWLNLDEISLVDLMFK